MFIGKLDFNFINYNILITNVLNNLIFFFFLQTKFDIDLNNPLVLEHLNATMGRAYRDNRYDHGKYFRSFEDPEEARRHPYKDMRPEDWDWLCTHFADENYQVIIQ